MQLTFETTIYAVELAGVAAFAISGAVTGIRCKMDVFGVCVLGLVTATGGGVVRDMMLGIAPPSMLKDPVFAILALVVAFIAFLPPVRRFVLGHHARYEKMMLLLDTVGLALFVAAGTGVAMRTFPDCGLFMPVFVGGITGVGGGILRDLFAGVTPSVFVKHVYASAALAGALVCALLWEPLGNDMLAMMAGAALIVIIRLLSAHFRWNLPHA